MCFLHFVCMFILFVDLAFDIGHQPMWDHRSELIFEFSGIDPLSKNFLVDVDHQFLGERLDHPQCLEF